MFIISLMRANDAEYELKIKVFMHICNCSGSQERKSLFNFSLTLLEVPVNQLGHHCFQPDAATAEDIKARRNKP